MGKSRKVKPPWYTIIFLLGWTLSRWWTGSAGQELFDVFILSYIPWALGTVVVVWTAAWYLLVQRRS